MLRFEQIAYITAASSSSNQPCDLRTLQTVVPSVKYSNMFRSSATPIIKTGFTSSSLGFYYHTFMEMYGLYMIPNNY
jgi:hypothetical protein